MHRTSRLPALALGVLLVTGTAACVGVQEEQMHPEVAMMAPAAGACGSQPEPGRLCGCVYDVSPEMRRLPDFAMLRPLELLCTDRLDLTLRSGPPGFPGVTSRYEYFGIDFTGDIVVSEPGVFGFRLASDDGAKLYVDDVLVLNNDGIHDIRTVEGSVALTAGPHHVHVPFYNGKGPMALILEVARPGQAYEILRVDQPL